MCVTTKEYACGHQDVIIQDCLTVKNLKMVQSRCKPKGRGFFNTVFCRKQRPDGAEIVCTAPAGIQSSRLPCPKCAPRPQTPENVRQIAEWKSKQRKTRDRNLVGAGVRVLDQSEIERRRLTTKWQWICSRCYAEGRTVESWHRTPNGGPCCARGADEFDAWEKREGYRSLDYDPSRFASRANRPRDLTPSPPPPPPKLRNPNLPTARPKRPTVVIPDEPHMVGLRRVSGHEDLRNHVITTPRESHWVPKIADSISNYAEPPAAQRKTVKHEEIQMPYLGEQFEVSFSVRYPDCLDSLHKLLQRQLQLASPSLPQVHQDH